jgi:hypothetical protein
MEHPSHTQDRPKLNCNPPPTAERFVTVGGFLGVKRRPAAHPVEKNIRWVVAPRFLMLAYLKNSPMLGKPKNPRLESFVIFIGIRLPQ